MSTKLLSLQNEAQAAVKTARELAEKANHEGRSMTETERSDYDVAMAKGKDMLEQIKIAKADLEVLDHAKALSEEIGLPFSTIEDLDSQGDHATRQRMKNLGLQVVSSDQFKAAMANFKGGHVPERTPFSTAPIPVKALITGASSTSAGAFVVNEQSGIVEMLGRKPLTVRDLVSVRRTSSDTVEYVEQTSHTNAAAPVAEATSSAAPTAPAGEGALVPNVGGGYKPEGAWAFARKTAVVKTIAEWVPASKRSLADVAALEGLIRDELAADIAEAEENQIVSGNGAGENLTGILETSGIQSQSFSGDLFASIRKGITKARTVGRVNPNGILMNPEDVEQVDLAKTDLGYLGSGPFGQVQRSLWGVPIIESESITAGNALLGDFSKAVLWDREQTTVTVTDSHEDFFVRNLVAILAEERVAFAVTRPKAFVNVDLSDS